jgi:hypothetical protein
LKGEIVLNLELLSGYLGVRMVGLSSVTTQCW